MKSLFIALSLAAVSTFSSAGIPDCLKGRWKSDEVLTLADMRRHPEVTSKARAMFENKFFGRLVLVFGSRYAGSHFEEDSGPTGAFFETLEPVSGGSDWVILRSRSSGAVQLQEWRCENGRIYALVTKWQFREYFSPLP